MKQYLLNDPVGHQAILDMKIGDGAACPYDSNGGKFCLEHHPHSDIFRGGVETAAAGPNKDMSDNIDSTSFRHPIIFDQTIRIGDVIYYFKHREGPSNSKLVLKDYEEGTVKKICPYDDKSMLVLGNGDCLAGSVKINRAQYLSGEGKLINVGRQGKMRPITDYHLDLEPLVSANDVIESANKSKDKKKKEAALTKEEKQKKNAQQGDPTLQEIWE